MITRVIKPIQIVRVTPLKTVSEDERGSNVALSIRPTTDLLLIKRKKGTVSGEHFHEGKSPEKNPETHILVSGEIELYCKDLKTGETFREVICAPALIEIFANVWHKVTALTDITFLELNSIEQHKLDTVRCPEPKT
ncbi:MAG: hypothetical protein Q8R15_01430 [Candidatus Micrarchaeota archaeon]|nr:hypothetical protein [Candidatus Micrarchaeota archaeon]